MCVYLHVNMFVCRLLGKVHYIIICDIIFYHQHDEDPHTHTHTHTHNQLEKLSECSVALRRMECKITGLYQYGLSCLMTHTFHYQILKLCLQHVLRSPSHLVCISDLLSIAQSQDPTLHIISYAQKVKDHLHTNS